jgi:2-(3-amino-3-carboxypropyl)histidine synthase
MIANPSVPAFRYDPYDKKFTREGYEHEEMRELRGKAVRQARRNVGLDGSAKPQMEKTQTEDEDALLGGSEGASGWSVVLGTLGRQGSLSVLKVSSHSTFTDSLLTLLDSPSPPLSQHQHTHRTSSSSPNYLPRN